MAAPKAQSESAPASGPGRPRDPKRQEAILDATRQILLEGGYGRVTFEAVAQRAGVSRMTVHKWWGHRAQLVEEALFSGDNQGPAPNTGFLRGDLSVLVTDMVTRLTEPAVLRGMPPLRADLHANSQLRKDTKLRYHEPALKLWTEVFVRAIERGEIPAATDPLTAMLVALGAIEVLAQFGPSALPRREIAPYLVDLMLAGVGTTAKEDDSGRASKFRARAGSRGGS